MTRWQNYSIQIRKDLQFWVFSVIYLMFFRIVLIISFRAKISDDVGFFDILDVLIHGAKFDYSVAAYFALVPFLLSAILIIFKVYHIQDLIRKVLFSFMAILSTAVFITSIEYFREYDNQFNHFLFLALYDDQAAVFKTLLDDYHLIEYLTFAGLFIPALFWLYKKWTAIEFSLKMEKIQKPVFQVLTVIFIFALFVSAMRGSFQKRPAIRKWASVSKDAFLNKTVMNPYIQFKYAMQDFKELNNSVNRSNPFLANDESISNVLNSYFSSDFSYQTISQYLEKKNKGSVFHNYDHIFLIVMESLDSWPFKKEYADFHLVDSLKQIAAEGQFYPNVLSASRSTMNTIAALTTGLPYTGRNISKIAIAPYKTSIIPKFKELGFKAQFFYGGFSSWQNIEPFMNAQNVDLVYTAPAMKTSESKKGAWGVDDDVLFDFAFNKISNEEKSFNILLTTSYHPPYNVDVEAKGFHFKEIPKELSNIYDGSMSLKQLGHVWYAAKAAADFIRKMKAAKANSLFVITGDHYSRRFLNAKPSATERTYVPVIIYGNKLQVFRDERVASHFDIFPTLLDLAADSNTSYHSFGESLLSKSLDSIKIGFEDAAINGKLSSREHLLQPRARLTEEENTLFKRYNQQNAISWHYTMKGDSIKRKDNDER